MSVLADFECRRCHQIHEALTEPGRVGRKCPACGGNAKRIISLGRVDTSNESPSWLKSVVDIVDKDSTKAHVREFVRNPTRRTYQNWMKGENIHPVDHTEHGGPPTYKRPQGPDLAKVREEIARKQYERRRVEA